jgi:hypothetical protein
METKAAVTVIGGSKPLKPSVLPDADLAILPDPTDSQTPGDFSLPAG